MAFTFHHAEPKIWTGPYGRIPGETTVFHVRMHPRKAQMWPLVLMAKDSDLGSCWAVDGPEADELAKTVLKAKGFLGGGSGGEFLINEFGQVLVPSPSGDGRRVYAGRVEGRLRFENPFDPGAAIDLSEDSGLSCGDPWPIPYVGCQYNLAAGGWVYTTLETRDGTTYPRLQSDCTYLIQSLRRIRPTGAVRFIVNPCGLVATKRHDGSQWHPVYVGRVRVGAWFEAEGSCGLNVVPQAATVISRKRR